MPDGLVLVDLQAVAVAPSDAEIAAWAATQRVFVSSVMGSLAEERRAVAAAIEEVGAEPVWFEDFGGRDQDPSEAYLSEVASSTVYIGILGREYGRRLPSGYSATHAEYREASARGLRLSVWARESDDMQGDERAFLDDVRLFDVTGAFTGPADLAQGVTRRLRRIGAEMLAPWCKLGGIVFRAEEIRDAGATLEVAAVVHDPAVAAALRELRGDGQFRPSGRLQFTTADDSAVVEVTGVEVVTTAARSRRISVSMRRTGDRADRIGFASSYRVGSSTYSSADLVELGVRRSLYGDEMPSDVRSFADVGDPWSTVRSTPLTQEVIEPVARLFFVEELVGRGLAARVTQFRVGPSHGGRRRVALGWLPAASTWSSGDQGERAVDGYAPA